MDSVARKVRDIVAKVNFQPKWVRDLALFVLARVFLRLLSMKFRGNQLRVPSILLPSSIWSDLKVVLNQGESRGNEKFELFPTPNPPHTPILSQLVGHMADLKPWSSDQALQMLIMSKKDQWYKEVGGDSVRVKIGDRDSVYTKDVKVIEEVLITKADKFALNQTVRDTFADYIPTNLISADGEKWEVQRNVIVRSLHRMDYDALVRLMNQVMLKSRNVFFKNETQEIELIPTFSKVIFDVFSQLAYGKDFNLVEGENQALMNDAVEASRIFGTLVGDPVWWSRKFPTWDKRKLKRVLTRLKNLASDLIKSEEEKFFKGGKQEKVLNRTIIEALVQSMHGEGKAHMTHEEVKELLMGLFFGGYDTTASTISFVLINLAHYPHVQEKLYNEVKDIDLSKVTMSELKSMEYLSQIFNESHRLLRISMMGARTAKEDVVINNKLVRAGTNINLDYIAMAHDSKLWHDTGDLNLFIPERWNDFNPDPTIYAPFGYGPRICPGRHLAFSEILALLVNIVQGYTVSPGTKPPQFRVSLGFTVTADTALKFTKRH